MVVLKHNGIELCRFVATNDHCNVEYSFRSNGWILRKPDKAWKRYYKIKAGTRNMYEWIMAFRHIYDGWKTTYTFKPEGSKLYTQQSLLYHKKARRSARKENSA